MQFEKSFAGISYSKTLCKQVIVWIFYIKLGLSYIDFFNGARKIRTKVIIQINVGKHYFRDSLQNLHIFWKCVMLITKQFALCKIFARISIRLKQKQCNLIFKQKLAIQFSMLGIPWYATNLAAQILLKIFRISLYSTVQYI